MGHTDPGPGCHGEAGDLQVMLGCLSTKHSLLRCSRKGQVHSLSPSPGGKLCCLCMGTRVNARVCPGSLSRFSLCQTSCHQIRPWFKQ